MPSFRLFGTYYICVDFSFLAVIALAGTSSAPLCMYLCLAACFLHEIGHLVLFRIFGIKITRLTFYFAGMRIERNCCCLTRFREGVILFGGCLVNFLLFLLFLSSESYPLRLFSAVNLIIGIFNLLPIEMLDGGQLLLLFSDGKDRLHRIVGILVSIIFPFIFLVLAGFFFFTQNVGFTVILTGVLFALYSAFGVRNKKVKIF